MKKLFTVFLCLCVIMTGCTSSDRIKIGDSVWDLYDRYNYVFREMYVVTFEVDDYYTTVVTDFDNVIKKVSFTPDRKAYDAVKLRLVKDYDVNDFLGLSLKQLERKLGKIHADLESGFYGPSYITEDGYLLYFSLDDSDMVSGCIKYDLLGREKEVKYGIFAEIG